MKIDPKKLSISKSSSIRIEVPVELSREVNSLNRVRAMAYIKKNRTDTTPLTNLEVSPINNTTLLIQLNAARASKIPVGQFFYFIELFVGQDKYSFSNYINIEP